ncbi:MAG: peptide chain release factor N(5)-glutamine methyltransferase [Alphaproteobacteria bacterium]|nr:peptide chain release factor N(5)-glutamine methyltransferase [Alphaproteobacteria bacterium]
MVEADRDPALTVGRVLCQATRRLRTVGIEGPRRDARLLLEASARLSRETLLADPHQPIPVGVGNEFFSFVERRAAGEPVSRILGRREFWGLSFYLSKETLDPRPDSETLIATALALRDRCRPCRLLDLGTGTGCLLLAYLQENRLASGVGIDRSFDAVRTARRNAQMLGLRDRAQFVVGDWSTAVSAEFDLVLANPPYVAAAEIASLSPEVRAYDPHVALSGGADGLEAYRRLAPMIRSLLRSGGVAVIEVGAGQADPVASLFGAAELIVTDRPRDLAGIARCLVLKARDKAPQEVKKGVD